MSNVKNQAFQAFFVLGLFLIVVSFVSEINFHYIQGFMPSLVESDIFWRAENVEAFNSTIFLATGIICIIMAFYFKKKK